jgi:hypothetical protein
MPAVERPFCFAMTYYEDARVGHCYTLEMWLVALYVFASRTESGQLTRRRRGKKNNGVVRFSLTPRYRQSRSKYKGKSKGDLSNRKVRQLSAALFVYMTFLVLADEWGTPGTHGATPPYPLRQTSNARSQPWSSPYSHREIAARKCIASWGMCDCKGKE